MVVGSYAGMTPYGSAAGNGAGSPRNDAGIVVDSNINRYGGTTTAPRNVIACNGGNGIFLNSTFQPGTMIQGNIVGLAADGSTARPNALSGVNLDGVDVTLVGGTVAGAGNVISGNTGTGLRIRGASGTRVQGNLIGL